MVFEKEAYFRSRDTFTTLSGVKYCPDSFILINYALPSPSGCSKAWVWTVCEGQVWGRGQWHIVGQSNLCLLIEGDKLLYSCFPSSLSSHGHSCVPCPTSSPKWASEGGYKWETHLSNHWTSHWFPVESCKSWTMEDKLQQEAWGNELSDSK